ncbi:MAG: (2Fe-2S) ferredoxin domain-containing protein [Bacilli bacterium]|nr:(2Fe-2S) ferredoxin domain-containing protein [Bacilli bacterium]
MEKKLVVATCVGSACHIRGSREVVEAMRKELSSRGLEERVEIKPAFCLGRCGAKEDGITVLVGEEIVEGVTVTDVRRLFDEKIVPLARA